jgi:hypothetical protein
MNNKEAKVKVKVSQVIGCRVTSGQWHQFEKKCIEKQVPMSKILQNAVTKFIASK